MLQYLYETDYSDSTLNLESANDVASGFGLEAEETEDEHNLEEIINLKSMHPAEINTRVYLMADKYIIPGLRKLARQKLEIHLENHWNNEEYISIIAIIYSPTTPKCQDLRNLVTRLAVKQLSSLQEQQRFRLSLKYFSEFTYDFSLCMIEKVLQLDRE
jgi:hypothetical protein